MCDEVFADELKRAVGRVFFVDANLARGQRHAEAVVLLVLERNEDRRILLRRDAKVAIENRGTWRHHAAREIKHELALHLEARDWREECNLLGRVLQDVGLARQGVEMEVAEFLFLEPSRGVGHRHRLHAHTARHPAPDARLNLVHGARDEFQLGVVVRRAGEIHQRDPRGDRARAIGIVEHDVVVGAPRHTRRLIGRTHKMLAAGLAREFPDERGLRE